MRMNILNRKIHSKMPFNHNYYCPLIIICYFFHYILKLLFDSKYLIITLLNLNEFFNIVYEE